MSTYEYALTKQRAERIIARRADEIVEAAIDQKLDEFDDALDPFRRERLKRRILESVEPFLDQFADEVATEALRQAK